ncbi:MAG: hypothetical protein ACKOBM_04370, partial [Gammaproteobacteria bacterium]
RTERLADLLPQADYLLGDRRSLAVADFTHPKVDLELCAQILDHVSRELDALRHWQRDQLFEICQSLANHMGLKIREFLFPLFIALSGRAVALPLFDSMVVLGPDLTRVRIREALLALGVSGKQTKRFEKQHRDYQRARPEGASGSGPIDEGG